MPIVSNEIRQQTAIAMLHDLDNTIMNLTNIKNSFMSSMCELVQAQATLDNDSPEYKQIEARRQRLAAYEKKIDAEIQMYQNRRQKAEGELQKSTQNVQRGIEMMYRGR